MDLDSYGMFVMDLNMGEVLLNNPKADLNVLKLRSNTFLFDSEYEYSLNMKNDVDTVDLNFENHLYNQYFLEFEGWDASFISN